MSLSMKWVSCVSNQQAVMAMYRGADVLTVVQIAKRLKTSHNNVVHVLKKHMHEDERKALAKLRYSLSKTGSKNPMKGKTGKQHHNWKGACDDGEGYLTVMHNGRRAFVHRLVLAEVLGIAEIPKSLVVHHIDGDRQNNAPDNLALMTRAAHRILHYLQAKEAARLQSQLSNVEASLKSTT